MSHFRDLTVQTKQEIEENVGTLRSSELDFFPLQIPAILPATQSTQNSPSNLVRTPHPNRLNNSDTPILSNHPTLPAQNPVSSVKIILPPSNTGMFSPNLTSTFRTNTINTPSQIAGPQVSTFNPRVPLKPTELKPSLIVHKNTAPNSITRPRLSGPTSLATVVSQQMPIFSLSNPSGLVPRNLTRNIGLYQPQILSHPPYSLNFLPLYEQLLRYQSLNEFHKLKLSIF